MAQWHSEEWECSIKPSPISRKLFLLSFLIVSSIVWLFASRQITYATSGLDIQNLVWDAHNFEGLAIDNVLLQDHTLAENVTTDTSSSFDLDNFSITHFLESLLWLPENSSVLSFIQFALYWIGCSAIIQALLIKEFRHITVAFLDNHSGISSISNQDIYSTNYPNNYSNNVISLYDSERIAYQNRFWLIQRKFLFPFGMILHLHSINDYRKTQWFAKDQFSEKDWRTLNYYIRQSKEAER